MSHAIELSAADAEAQGIPVFRNKTALIRACVAQNLLSKDAELKWVEGADIGMGNPVTGYEVRFPGWSKPAYFNTEAGSVGFDNWPIYDADHAEVRSGKRRVGEEGRWGDFQHMLNLEAAYCDAASQLMVEYITEEAAKTGEMARVVEETEEEYVMEILN